MNWKDTIRKEISDKDMKEMLEEGYDEEFETGERGSDNSVQRDRDDTFDPVARLRKDPKLQKLRVLQKMADKLLEEITRANLDKETLMKLDKFMEAGYDDTPEEGSSMDLLRTALSRFEEAVDTMNTAPEDRYDSNDPYPSG